MEPFWRGGWTREREKLGSRPSNSLVPSLFRADWADPVVLERTFLTNVTASKAQVEKRVGLLSKPYISCTASFKAQESEELDSTRLMAMLDQIAGSRPIIPVWCEFFTVTVDAIVGATSLTVRSTSDRLIKAGSEVLICYPEGRTRWRYETASVSTLSGTTVFLTGGLANAYPAGSRVFLAMRSEAALEANASLVTRRTGRANLSFREVHDPGVIEPTTPIGTITTGSSFNSLPILDVFYDWADGVDVSQLIDGTSDVVGLENVTEIEGTKSRIQAQLVFKTLTRSGATKIRKFFDSRGGRLLPFWLPWPSEDFSINSASTTELQVEVKGNSAAYLSASVGGHIAIISVDGSIRVARIASVTISGSNAILTFASAISSPGSIKRASWCSLVRFDSDSISESWLTDEMMSASLSVIGLKVSGDAEDNGSPPFIPDVEEGTELPQWTAFGGCAEGAPVPTQPMYQADCHSVDFNRPLFRVSDLVVPQKIALTFGTDWARNISVPGADLGGLIQALTNRRQWFLTYSSSNSGTSRHWHHLRFRPIPTWQWDDASIGGGGPGTAPTVDRYIFTTSANYFDSTGTSRTLEIRVVFEASNSLTKGGWGTFCHLYVFTDELNAYTDGTSWNQSGAWTTAVTFTRDDPAVFEFTDFVRRCHPQLAICATIPTTMECACGFTQSRASQQIVKTPQPNPGLPWTVGYYTDWYFCRDNSCMGHSPTYAPYMLGGDVDGSRLMEYVCIFNGVAGLNAGRPGFVESVASLSFASSIDIAICGPTGTGVSHCEGHPASFNKGSVKAIKFSDPDVCCLSVDDLILGVNANHVQSVTCTSGSSSSCLGIRGRSSLSFKPYRAEWNEGVPGYLNTVARELEWVNGLASAIEYSETFNGWSGFIDDASVPGSPLFTTSWTSGECSGSIDMEYVDSFSQYDYDPGSPPHYRKLSKRMRPAGRLPFAPDPFDGMVNPVCGVWIALTASPKTPAEQSQNGFCGPWVVYSWSTIAVP